MKCPKCQCETVVVGAFNICPEHGPVNGSPTPGTEGVDPDALKAAMLRLPTVLVMPISEYLEETNPVLRLWHICEITELSLRMLVIIGIAEHAKSLPGALLREMSDRIERPTMGSWLGMAQAVAKHLPVTTLNPELREAVEKLAVLIGNQASSPDSGCLSLRNLLAHGGGMRKSVAEKYLVEWIPRFIEIINALSWLSDCCIAGRDRQGQLHILKGPNPQDHTDDASLTVIPTGDQPDQLLLIRGGRNLILWPLGRYATTGSSDQGGDKQDQYPQLYIRRGEVRLQYLNFGGDGAVSDSDASALDTFLELFTVKEQAPSTTEYSVPGFDGEFYKEASRRIGRERELETLGIAIHEMRGGLLWLGGVAGMGKSCLIASAVVEIQAQPPEGAVVLVYRFRASDNRCYRETFLRFAIERLEPWDGLVPREKQLPETTIPIDRLKDCLARVQSVRRILFVLDGLDEILERDANFAREVILPLASDHTGFVCVGRPERGIPEAFRQASAREPFPEGLPPMSQDDVRAMLVTRTEGPLRKRLIKRDKEAGDRIINPFIERVTKLSEGLPLYVNYVIGDVLEGKIAPEAEGQLPAGLHAYHEELLRRCAIGDLQAVVTPMVAMLAVAYEPLTAEVLAAILLRRGVMRDPDVQLVGRGLVALASMIRRAPNADGEDGYTLYHASLRQHILKSEGMRHTVGTTRKTLADAAQKPAGDIAEKYLYRCGVRHIQDDGRRDEALRLLTDFDYVMTRLQKLGGGLEAVAGYYRDWDAVSTAKTLADETEIWGDFLSLNRHLLMQGNVAWGAHKILLQLAIEHADDSPLTKAGKSFLSASKCSWLWLKNVRRPRELTRSPCLAILNGSWARELSTGRLLCWSDNNILGIWDRVSSKYVCDLRGHTGSVSNAIELTDHRILSWSHSDRTLRVWDSEKGECLTVLYGHSGGVEGALEISDGSILSWATDATLRSWDANTGKCTAEYIGHSIGKCHFIGSCGAKELEEGRILSWTGDDRTLRVWEGRTGRCLHVLQPKSGTVTSGYVLSDGRIMSWGFDGSANIWDKVDTQTPLVLRGHTMKINGVRQLSNGHILSWSNDGTLRIWDNMTGQCVATLIGHTLGRIGYFGVSGAVELSDGRILSCAGDGTLRIWDSSSGECIAILEGHSAPVIGALQMRNGHILSWSADCSIRIWAGAIPKCVSVYEGHTSAVLSAMELTDGQILSCSDDKTLRIWRQIFTNRTHTPRHRAQIRGVLELSNGRFLSWADMDSTLLAWDESSGYPVLPLEGHTYDIGGALELEGGRILTWSFADDTMRVWDQLSGKCLLVVNADELNKTLRSFRRNHKNIQNLHGLDYVEEAEIIEGHTSGVKGALRLTDGRVLTWSADKALRVWSKDGAHCLCVLMGHTTDVEGAMEQPNGRILSWDNRELRFWDGNSGDCLSILQGCASWPSKMLMLSNNRFLSWSCGLIDTSLRILDPVSGNSERLLKGHSGESNIGAVELADGHLLSWSWKQQKGIILHLWNTSTGTLLHSYTLAEAGNGAKDLWWAFVCNEGKSASDWGAIRDGLFHRSGTKVSCVISGKLNHYQPHCLKPSGVLVASSGTTCNFLQLMAGSRPVGLAEASRLTHINR